MSSPFADAVELPKRPVKVTCPKAAANAGDGDSRDRGLSRSVSAADSESSTASTESTVHSELTRYIAQHYNPGAEQETIPCLLLPLPLNLDRQDWFWHASSTKRRSCFDLWSE